ncbi:MAG: hypothetical protein OHK0039_03850 [Bacteroidia bacterium]
MIRTLTLSLCLLLLVPAAQAQRGCIRQLMTDLQGLHAYFFVPQSMSDSLAQRSGGKAQFYTGREAAWRYAQLQAHMGEVVAIRPVANADDPCSLRQIQAMQKRGLILLVPADELALARSKGFEPTQGSGAQDATWNKLLDGFWSLLKDQAAAQTGIDLQKLLPTGGGKWYTQPIPADFQPERGADSFLFNGQPYVCMRLP